MFNFYIGYIYILYGLYNLGIIYASLKFECQISTYKRNTISYFYCIFICKQCLGFAVYKYVLVLIETVLSFVDSIIYKHIDLFFLAYIF